jgi:hypothetical protein
VFIIIIMHITENIFQTLIPFKWGNYSNKKRILGRRYVMYSIELLDWRHANLLASVRQKSKENSPFLLLKAGLWVCVYFSWDIPTYFVLFLSSQCVCMAFMSSLPPSVFRHAFVPNLIFHNSQSDHFCFWSFCNCVSYFAQCTDIDISDIHLVDKKYPRKYPQTLIQNAQVQTTLVHFLDEEQRFILYVQIKSEPSSGILHRYHLTRGPRSPVKVIAQVQWLMYHNRLEPSSGI